MHIFALLDYAVAPPPEFFEAAWLAISKFFAETKVLRGLELAALGAWLWEHWIFAFGALVMAVWIFSARGAKG